jgi:hypothetical protein
MTALFVATYDAIGSTLEYSKRLIDQDFDCNGGVYIITDGMDNRSSMSARSIKKKVEDGMVKEDIEPIVTILVALQDPSQRMGADVKKALEAFQKDANLSQFVDIGDATPGKLAKLANFADESVCSQSQALGSRAPSQTLNF